MDKFSTIHVDLVTEVTINREVKFRSVSMRDGYSNFSDAENDFILHSYTPPNPRKEMESKMNLKIDSDYIESIQDLLKTYWRL